MRVSAITSLVFGRIDEVSHDGRDRLLVGLAVYNTKGG